MKEEFWAKFGGNKRRQKYLTNVANDVALMILGKIASRVFAQWREPVFDETGKMLDGRMDALIRKIAA